MVIHELIPTNIRLHRLRTVDTEDCTLCGKQDTIIHRLTECGTGEEIWEWTRIRLAAIHRTDRRRIPPGWLLGPTFRLWPRQRHLATLWILANLVFYLVAESEREGTRAETTIGLSAKRTSPFKSAGESVQSTTGSRGVRISRQDYWLPTPFASFPFTSPPVRHRVPSHFNWSLTFAKVPRTSLLDTLQCNSVPTQKYLSKRR